jgi:CubicO group peptidase (beta-lactamase class C family)
LRLASSAASLACIVTSVLGCWLVTAAPVAASAGPRHELTAADAQRFLDSFVPQQLTHSGIPGAVVVIVGHGRVLAASGYGVADVQTHRPMTADRTLVNIASIKKLFEGVAIMQLVEQRRLDLDRDVSDYLDFSIPTPPGGVPVTLRRLMTHRAGFEDRFKNSNRSFAELLPYRLFPYGDVPAYSNYGASLSGYILGRVTGKPLAAYVTENVLTPLGMTSSSFAVRPPDALMPMMAVGYQVTSGTAPSRLDEYFTDLQLNTTGDDMARFLLAVLNAGAIDGRRILQPATLATMMARQATSPLAAMGLYFYERDVDGIRFIGHRGDTSAFQCDVLFAPKASVGLFVAYNAEGDGSPRDDLEQALVARYFIPPTKRASTFSPRAADAAAVAGWYERTRRADSNVFSIEELFAQRRVRANADGSITTGNAGLFVKDPAWVTRREIAPFVFQTDSGDTWAFEAKRGGLEILEYTDGTAARERMPWYRIADLVQALMALSIAVMVLSLLSWPVVALLRRFGALPAPVPADSRSRRAALFVRLLLCLELGVATAVVLLLQADWDKRQIFVDALDPWLVALYVAAWLAVAGTPVVVWIAWRSWMRQGTGLWVRLGYTLVATAMLVGATFAVVWRVAGTTLNY